MLSLSEPLNVLFYSLLEWLDPQEVVIRFLRRDHEADKCQMLRDAARCDAIGSLEVSSELFVLCHDGRMDAPGHVRLLFDLSLESGLLSSGKEALVYCRSQYLDIWVAMFHKPVKFRCIRFPIQGRIGRQRRATKAPTLAAVDQGDHDLLQRARTMPIVRRAEQRVK